jgi:hypothetical protein
MNIWHKSDISVVPKGGIGPHNTLIFKTEGLLKYIFQQTLNI